MKAHRVFIAGFVALYAYGLVFDPYQGYFRSIDAGTAPTREALARKETPENSRATTDQPTLWQKALARRSAARGFLPISNQVHKVMPVYAYVGKRH